MRFSLRGLLLLMTAVAVWCGVFLGRARNERLAAEAVEAAGGTVIYDWQDAGALEPPHPPWLREAFGEHFFDRIVSVDLRLVGHRGEARFVEVARRLSTLTELRELSLWAANLDDADFEALDCLDRLTSLWLTKVSAIHDHNAAHLTSLRSLRKLVILHTAVSDDALAEIARLTRLEELHVDRHVVWSPPPENQQTANQCKTVDDAVKALAACKRLRSLELHGCEVSDAAVIDLCRLKNLESFSLSSPYLTGRVLHEVKRLGQLTRLGIWLGQIDNDDLLALHEMPSLTNLSLSTSPGTTNSCLAHLARLKQLEALYLGVRSDVTAAGLHHLHGLSNLRYLNLSGSQVNPLSEETERLRAALPNCRVLLPKSKPRSYDWRSNLERWQATPAPTD